MARYATDISKGRDDAAPPGYYWKPDTPDFLEKREERRAASQDSARSYEQARAESRRKLQESWAKASQRGAAAAAGQSGQASIIDFERLSRGGAEPPAGEDTGRPSAGSHGPGSVSGAGFGSGGGAFRSGGFDSSFGFGGGVARFGRFGFSASRASETRTPGGNRVPTTDRAAFAADYRGSRGWADAWRVADAPIRSARETAAAPSRRVGGWDSAGAGGQAEAARPALGEDRQPDARRRAPSDVGARMREARRERRRQRADRAFARAYGDGDAERGGEGDGPRAAVYETHMGHAHQRAARMQARETGVSLSLPPFFGKIAAAVSLDRIVAHRWFARTALAFACTLLVGFALFPAAQDYYLKSRANDQLAAEYQAVLERNDQLEQRVADLQTDEGMEQLAHDSLGWVSEGENSVSVVGGTSDDSAGASGEYDAVPEGSVPAPETWYSPVLDVIFGYGG